MFELGLVEVRLGEGKTVPLEIFGGWEPALVFLGVGLSTRALSQRRQHGSKA